jgi:hypothetical protein
MTADSANAENGNARAAQLFLGVSTDNADGTGFFL